MTVADRFRAWASRLDLWSFMGVFLVAICVVATAVFGLIPNQGMLAANAFISGTVWSACLMAIRLGGQRIDRVYYFSCCLIAGGLTTSIPAIFYEHTVVDWGSTISRLGFAIFVLKGLVDAFDKWRMQHEVA